jgi:hypothetical protein
MISDREEQVMRFESQFKTNDLLFCGGSWIVC